eukprot:3028141-Amphidinium_carterae.1
MPSCHDVSPRGYEQYGEAYDSYYLHGAANDYAANGYAVDQYASNSYAEQYAGNSHASAGSQANYQSGDHGST